MAPHFQFDENSHEVARIKILGVGGGGGNAINYMIEKGLNSVEYISLNTDRQALSRNRSDVKIQVGSHLTGGLGAGARPEIGREAVEESRNQIEEAVEGADMVFITAGMGGGTGTGGAPVIAGIARRKGILTVGIVTTPFHYEGKVRMQYALEGISEMRMNCDTLIVIPNERLLELSDETTSMVSAFAMANDVLYNATKGISDLVILPGLINLDFADVRTTMTNGGAAIMGSASASGAERAEVAAMKAIHSPLLDGVSMQGARNVLVNISSDESLGMHETMTATRIIKQEAGDDAEIIIGTVLDPANEDQLRVTVIATGFELEDGSPQIRLAPADRAGGHSAKFPPPRHSGAGMAGLGASRPTGLSGGTGRPGGAGEMSGPMRTSGGSQPPSGFPSPYSGNAGHSPMQSAYPGGGDWNEHASGMAPFRSAGPGAAGSGSSRNVQGPHTDPMQMDERLESGSNDFYKGERNLKNLDTPAIQRRQIQHNTGQRYADEDHSLQGGRPDARPDDAGAAARGFGPADHPRPRLSVIPGTTGGQGDSWGSRHADFDADEQPASPPAWKRTVNSPELGRNSGPAEGGEHEPRAYGAPRDMAPGASGSQPAGTTRENRPNDWQEKQKIDKSDPDQPAFLRKIMD